ncbi:hypothetical protein EV175_000555, partial [Coemansia sp. RSA 1933]
LFHKYLVNIESIEPLDEFSLVNTQEFPSELLYELVQIWRNLEKSPSRSRFGPTAVSLCCAVGSAIASGWIDAQLSNQHNIRCVVSKAMHWLDIDEAYIAWRLVILIGEQYPELSKWDADLEARIAAFWNATLERSAEYIRIDNVPDRNTRHPVAHHRSLDEADIRSLEQIFSTERQSLLDNDARTFSLGAGIPSCQQTGMSSILPSDLSMYVADIDALIPDTRIRRALDTVVASISQCMATQEKLPLFVVSSLATIHSLFVSVTSTIDSDKDKDRDENSRILVFEYVRFLWNIWLLELPIAQTRCVFRTMSVVVWDRLLSFGLWLTPIHSGTADRGDGLLMSGIARRVYTLTGWLLTRSSPVGAAGGRSILEPAVCKLAFSRIARTVAEAAKVEHERLSTEFVTQSIDNLSVVSIPEESAWNLAGHRPAGASSADQTDILANNLTSLLYATVVSCTEEQLRSENEVSQQQQQDTVLSKAAYSVRLAKEAEIIPSIVWQTCNAAVDIGSGAENKASCISVFSDLASSGVAQLSLFAKEVSAHILRWLLAGSYNANVVFGGAIVEHKQRRDMAHAWLELVVSWIVPDDISSPAAIRQHIQFLRTFRTSLLDASCMVESPQDFTSLAMCVVESGVLSELLGLVQLVCTVDSGRESVSGSLLSSFGDRSRSGKLSNNSNSEGIGRSIGELLGESTKLLAFLIHDMPASKGAFASLGGYKTVHSCIDSATQNNAAVACLPLAEGVMALLSGVAMPYSRRIWTERSLDSNWIPTMTLLYSRLNLVDCVPVHRFIEQWCKGDSHVGWRWSQSTIVRQSIERLQNLFTNASYLELDSKKRRDCTSAFLKSLGRMLAVVMGRNMCVSDLKLAMRTLASGPGGSSTNSELFPSTDELAEYTLMVRRMMSLVLLRCAEGEAGGSYFSFGGRESK